MNYRYSRALLLSTFVSLPISAMEHQQQQQSLDTSQIVRIMSYNIRRQGSENSSELLWHNRLPLITKLIERLKPDILGVQEATESQLTDLQKEFKQFGSMGMSRGSSWLGWAADEYNQLLYDEERFTVDRGDTFKINKTEGLWTPNQASETGLLPRICTRARFTDKVTKKVFWVYNTHLDNKFPQARFNGLKVIAQNIKDRGDNYPVILMGDFNAELDDLSESNLHNVISNFRLGRDIAHYNYGPRETRTGWDGVDVKAIDYILISDPHAIKVDRYEVVEKEKDESYPSDHRPVVVDLTINGKE